VLPAARIRVKRAPLKPHRQPVRWPQRDPWHRLDLGVGDEPKPEALRDHGEATWGLLHGESGTDADARAGAVADAGGRSGGDDVRLRMGTVIDADAGDAGPRSSCRQCLFGPWQVFLLILEC